MATIRIANSYKRGNPLIIVLILWLNHIVFGQQSIIQFSHLTTDQGLSSNTVQCIMQDSYGFLWIGTNKGLNKYDGYSFTKFMHDPKEITSLSSDNITAIIEDKNKPGTLWIATSLGLNKFERENEIFSRFIYESDNPNTQRYGYIKELIQDQNGTIWIGALSDGIYQFDPANEEFTVFSLPSAQNKSGSYSQINAIYFDHNNEIWIAIYNVGLLYLDRNGKQKKFWSEKDGLISDNIEAIAEDAEGNLWLGSYGKGLIKFDRKTSRFAVYQYELNDNPSLRINFVTGILIDLSGMIWFGSQAEGFGQFNPKIEQFAIYKNNVHDPLTISGNNITEVFQDRSGLIWVGTRKGGLNKFQPQKIEFFNFKHEKQIANSLSDDRIHALCEDAGENIWIGTLGSGLNRFDPRTRTFAHFRHDPKNLNSLSNDRVTSIVSDKNQILWIGGFGGLDRFDPKSDSFKNYLPYPKSRKGSTENKIFSLTADRAGFIWIGTIKSGLARFDPATEQFVHYTHDPADSSTISSNGILSICEDRNGNIWVGTVHGLNLFDRKRNRFIRYLKRINDLNSLSSNRVNEIFEDSQGILWIGTAGSGLDRFDPEQKQFTHFTENDGLASNWILSIREDNESNLWFGTSNGLSKFDRQSQFFRNYSFKQGVENRSFFHGSALMTKKGHLCFGGHDGFVYFDPRTEDKNIVIPHIAITNFQVYYESVLTEEDWIQKRSISEPKEIRLTYNDYVFLIEFSILDFTSSEKNRYAYKLEGVDSDWHDLGTKRLLTFISLPPNEYTFRVKGCNSKGIWNETGLSLRMVITPLYYQTWWFRIVTFILLVGLVFGGYRIRVYSIRRRNIELEAINKKLHNEIFVRKQVENLLKDSESKYRTLVESIDESIYTISADGVFLFMNETAARRFSVNPKDIIGKSAWDLTPQENVQKIMDVVEKVIATGDGKVHQAVFPISGKEHHFRIGVQPLKNGNGEVYATLCVATDITEQIELEEQLRQSQKMEAIGKLAGGIAHDFNNLLSVIRGYSYLILMDLDKEHPLFENIQEIDIAGERAQALTRQLLAFSRKQMLDPKIMDLNKRIRELQRMFKPIIGENIEVVNHLQPGISHIFADPGQIEQVILNLIVNARDAMPQGGKLSIETKDINISEEDVKDQKLLNHGSYVMLTISDNGVGMSKKVQQRIFEPFFTTKDKGQGTGLGLSTVFGIVRQSEGFIWVESEPGKGSSFRIYFPSVDKKALAIEEDGQPAFNLRGDETILVTEDEDGVRKMICKMLRLYGYHAFEASDGKKAQNLYQNHKNNIDLILTDVVMPEMSGIELVDQLRLINPALKVLYMSGYTDDAIVRHGIIDRGIQFIQKPFTPEALVKKIREIIANQ